MLRCSNHHEICYKIDAFGSVCATLKKDDGATTLWDYLKQAVVEHQKRFAHVLNPMMAGGKIRIAAGTRLPFSSGFQYIDHRSSGLVPPPFWLSILIGVFNCDVGFKTRMR